MGRWSLQLKQVELVTQGMDKTERSWAAYN